MKKVLFIVLSVMVTALSGSIVAQARYIGPDSVVAADTSETLMYASEIPDHSEVIIEDSIEQYESLYDSYMGIDNADAVGIISEQPSDLSKLCLLSDSDNNRIVKMLKAYEVKKAIYLYDDSKDLVEDARILSAWEKQKEVEEFYFGCGDNLVELHIPTIRIQSITTLKDRYIITISEWMTVGYYDASISDILNFSAYRAEYRIEISMGAGTQILAVDNIGGIFTDVEESSDGSADVLSDSCFDGTDPDTYTDIDPVECLGASLPGYNINAAISYANEWAYDRNPEYNDYSGMGGDCANFVSQCLHAGGIPMDPDWNTSTLSWTGTISQSDHLCRKYGLDKLVATNDNILPGCPVYYQWHSDWRSDYDVDHVTICTGYNSQGVPVVNGHTRDIKNYPWRYGYDDTTYMTLQLTGSNDTLNNTIPIGCFDGATGGQGEINVWGWAYDKNAPASSQVLQIHVYVGGPAGSGAKCYVVKTGKYRGDVVGVYPDAYAYCGFDENIKVSERGTQKIYVYAIDANNPDEHLTFASDPITVDIRSPELAIKYEKDEIRINKGQTINMKFSFTGDGIYCLGGQIYDDTLIDADGFRIDSVDYAEGTARFCIKGIKGGNTTFSIVLLDSKGNVLKSEFIPLIVVAPVTSLKLNKTSVSLTEGETDTLSVTVSPADATNKSISWRSSNTSVVTVSGGKITAKKSGSATITAAAADGSGIKASCTVSVIEPKPVIDSMHLSKTSLLLEIGQKDRLTATTYPDNKGTIAWMSDNKNVASVGKDGTVQGVSAGNTRITAISVENSKVYAVCEVTVVSPKNEMPEEKNYRVSFYNDGIMIYTENVKEGNTVINVPDATGDGTFMGWYTEGGTIWNSEVPVCEDLNLNAVFEKNDVSTGIDDGFDVIEVIDLYLVKGQNMILDIGTDWVASDDNVIKVKKSKITATGAGTTTLESKEGHIVNCVVVQPEIDKKLSLVVGNSARLDLTGLEDHIDEYDITWISANREIVKVDDDGVVTGLSKGTSKVSAYINGKAYSCKVTVSDRYRVTGNEGSIRIKPLQKIRVKYKGFDLKNAEWKADNGLNTIYRSNNKIGYYENDNVRITPDGSILGIGPGMTKLTVSKNGISHSFELTVEDGSTNEIYIKNGKTRTIKHDGVKTRGENAATWSSSDNGIVTVTKKGQIKGVSQGDATIICCYNPYGTEGFEYKTIVHVE